ncbi:MAG: Ig-like domain-containing protein [Bacillota bacterium]|nr:Ig-like domain-containing protein [Bacillota bacterium]
MFSPLHGNTGSKYLLTTAAFFLLFIFIALLNTSGCAKEPVYEGEMMGDLPDGFGTWKHPGGSYYAGEFKEGLRHGRGTWIHPDGIRYAGQWQEDEYHGLGALIINGQQYIGWWNRGSKEGPGVQQWADGWIYKGNWLDDRPQGYGIMEKPDGSLYRGYWQEGYRQGQGTAIYPDGSQYIGHWESDNRHGSGRLIKADGTIYEGKWVNDSLQGAGTLIRTDGTVLRAIWSNNELQKIPVESVELDTENLTLIAGEEGTIITANVIPAEATDRDISWTSSDPDVAAVKDGLVQPLSPGSALITATCSDGNHTAACRVTVLEEYIGVSNIELDRSSIYLKVEETAVLIATIHPADAIDKTIYWHSGDPSVATVASQGPQRALVTAVEAGQAIITATAAENGLTARCTVSITPQIWPEDRIIVPRLLGKSLDQAKSIIRETGLIMGDVIYENHHSIPEGQVIRQEPPVGSFVSRDRLVNLVISSGQAEPGIESQPDKVN